TRFWINNPSAEEMEAALAAGAISCTTNPTFGAKLLQSDRGVIQAIIDRVVRDTEADDAAADAVAQQATAPLLQRLLPQYERSGGAEGFVTIQSDPRRDEEAGELVEAALRYHALGPNFMAKIPVTAAGLAAIESLVADDVPVCATEIFSLAQAI